MKKNLKIAALSLATVIVMSSVNITEAYANVDIRTQLAEINQQLEVRNVNEDAAVQMSAQMRAEVEKLGTEINSYTIHAEYLQERHDLINEKLEYLEGLQQSPVRKLFLNLTNTLKELSQTEIDTAVTSDFSTFKSIATVDMNLENRAPIIEGLKNLETSIELEQKLAIEKLLIIQSGIDTKMAEVQQIDQTVAILNEEINTLSAQKAVTEVEVQKLDAQEAEARRIQEEARKQEEARRAQEEAARRATTFIKPTSGRLTSPFGNRIHPVTRARSFHSGIDLANSTGTAILASRNGVVERVGYQGSYGNVVIINHGNGVTTLYAHLSGFNVRVGQNVQQGERIASMGSTGRSTGSHLHFEIRQNGNAVNPLSFIR